MKLNHNFYEKITFSCQINVFTQEVFKELSLITFYWILWYRSMSENIRWFTKLKTQCYCANLLNSTFVSKNYVKLLDCLAIIFFYLPHEWSGIGEMTTKLFSRLISSCHRVSWREYDRGPTWLQELPCQWGPTMERGWGNPLPHSKVPL